MHGATCVQAQGPQELVNGATYVQTRSVTREPTGRCSQRFVDKKTTGRCSHSLVEDKRGSPERKQGDGHIKDDREMAT